MEQRGFEPMAIASAVRSRAGGRCRDVLATPKGERKKLRVAKVVRFAPVVVFDGASC